MPRYRHLILDRDGTLNHEAPGGYVLEPEQWLWLPGVAEALARLTARGYRLSVATNQSCVGRGLVTPSMLDRIHGRMRDEAARLGATITAVYCCPHVPADGCGCRKPSPGLVEQAISRSGIPREETVLIGDSARDLQAAWAAGVTPWLVRTGKGRDTVQALEAGRIAGLEGIEVPVVDDLAAAYDALNGEP